MHTFFVVPAMPLGVTNKNCSVDYYRYKQTYFPKSDSGGAGVLQSPDEHCLNKPSEQS